MLCKPKNTGLIHKPAGARDWRFGGVSGAPRKVLREDGQWDSYLPTFERQRRFGFECMGCVSFSLNNCLETHFKLVFDREPNYSDRWLAKVSDTGPRGNTFYNVAMAARKKGLADEGTWAWTENVDTWDEYYGEPSSKARESAMRFLEKYDVLFEWVKPQPEDMVEALKYGPLQACSDGHAYEVCGYEAGGVWKIFDTYPYSGGTGIRTVDWGHEFLGVMLHSIVEKVADTSLLELANDCLVFEGSGPGRVGLHVNEKMYVDDPALIQLQWHTRNADAESQMFTGAPCVTVTTEQFSSFPHYDLKGNQLQ